MRLYWPNALRLECDTCISLHPRQNHDFDDFNSKNASPWQPRLSLHSSMIHVTVFLLCICLSKHGMNLHNSMHGLYSLGLKKQVFFLSLVGFVALSYLAWFGL